MEAGSLYKVKGPSPRPDIGDAGQGEFISIKGLAIECGIALISMVCQVVEVHIGLRDLAEDLIVGKGFEFIQAPFQGFAVRLQEDRLSSSFIEDVEPDRLPMWTQNLEEVCIAYAISALSHKALEGCLGGLIVNDGMPGAGQHQNIGISFLNIEILHGRLGRLASQLLHYRIVRQGQSRNQRQKKDHGDQLAFDIRFNSSDLLRIKAAYLRFVP